MTAITKELATKVLSIVDAGLIMGVGVAEPGKMCVEAAVCYALGEPHGDKPTCVGPAVRNFKIRLNDSRWSSDTARAKGLRRIAIAQLGSNEIDQLEFAKRVTLGAIREILPDVLRKRWPEHADACAKAETLEEGRKAAYAAAAAAYADADAAAYAYADADADADAAYASAAATAAYAAYAADAYAAADAADRVLTQAAEIGVRVLIELNSPGAQFLEGV